MLARIGDIVRQHREGTQVSLEDLAHRSGVPLSTLSSLEQGQAAITTAQLDDVAEALALDPAALLNGQVVQRSMASVFLRHAPLQDFDERDGCALDGALEQGRSLIGLQCLLGDRPSALLAGEFVPREAAADRSDAPAHDGYRLARAVRQWLGIPAEPLGDMRALLEERFGVAVVVRRLSSNRVTAVAIRAETAAAVVLSANDLQRARNPLLARVYLAHELCHVLFDPSQGGLHIVIDVVADRKRHAAEQRAGSFAAELLLPKAGLIRTLGDPSTAKAYSTGAALELITSARSRFGTPHEIAVNHLCNLGYVDHGLRDWLVAEATAFMGPVPETSLPDDFATSRFVATLVERAHREGRLTDGEARATLELDRLAPLPWEQDTL